jgi:hypothetical protein
LDRFIAFRTAHADLFEGARSANDVALVEPIRSRANNCVDPYMGELLALNGLLAGRVPFDLLGDRDPSACKRYRALVVPEAECMSDEHAAQLVDYVRGGGGLVVTGLTSMYDEWYRARPEPALAPLLRRAKGYGPLRQMDEKTVLRGALGKGRFAYLRRLMTGTPFRGYEMTVDGPNLRPEVWRVPTNQRALLANLRWVLRGRSDVAVKGPAGLAAEARQTADGRLAVHLVNYRVDRSAPGVSVDLPGKTVKSAALWSPWNKRAKKLSVTTRGGRDCVVVGPVKRYAVVEVKR